MAAATLALVSLADAETVTDWQPLVREASLRFGIPVSWIERIMQAESGGRTRRDGRPIRSSAGAMGLMQLMPATWTEIRARLRLGDDPDQPRDNILAGTFYLRLMYDRFGYPGLFAAYNAGPARYADYLAGRSSLPSETIAYLASVTSGTQVRAPVLDANVPVGSLFVVRRAGPQSLASTVAAPAADPLFAVVSRGN